MATIRVSLVDGPLAASPPASSEGCGAVWAFEGIVRPREEGRLLDALDYEAYEPMTTQELRRLSDRIATKHDLLSLVVEHSVGRVAPGEPSFRLVLTSRHRAEGHRAAAEFIDEMKRRVPLWKNPVFHNDAGLTQAATR